MLLLKKIHERSIILMGVFALLVGFTSACIDDGSRDSVGFTQGASHDGDNDGVPDNPDNCPGISNSGQENNDGDYEPYDGQMGDACDDDDDNDGVEDVNDNCQFTYNPDQLNTDWELSEDENSTVVGDQWGDACDDDDDNDDVCDMGVMLYNADVLPKSECEGWDNCQFTYNPDQENLDQDYWGDVCDDDGDWDGVFNDEDNCPETQNRFQEDLDQDGMGDACDPDDDNDGACDPHHEARLPSAPWLEESPDQCTGWDNCPDLKNPDQADWDIDGKGDWCDGDCRGDGFFEAYYPEDFPNHYCDGDDNCTLDSEECDDKNNCTLDYWCSDGEGGECTHEKDFESDDEDCIEWCNNQGQGQCNDHDPCTDDDCEGNTCEHQLDHTNLGCEEPGCDNNNDCEDNNPCTDDVCNQETGQCSHSNNTASCSDGLYCNGAEMCSGGVCQNPPDVVCASDGNVCTDDVCNEATDSCGVNNTASCDDGNSCTTGDMCANGVCAGTGQCSETDVRGDTPLGVSGANGGPNADGTPDNYDDDGDGYCETAPCVGSRNPALLVANLLGGDCDDDQDDATTFSVGTPPNNFTTDGSYANHPGAEEFVDGFDNNCDGTVI